MLGTNNLCHILMSAVKFFVVKCVIHVFNKQQNTGT